MLPKYRSSVAHLHLVTADAKHVLLRQHQLAWGPCVDKNWPSNSIKTASGDQSFHRTDTFDKVPCFAFLSSFTLENITCQELHLQLGSGILDAPCSWFIYITVENIHGHSDLRIPIPGALSNWMAILLRDRSRTDDRTESNSVHNHGNIQMIYLECLYVNSLPYPHDQIVVQCAREAIETNRAHHSSRRSFEGGILHDAVTATVLQGVCSARSSGCTSLPHNCRCCLVSQCRCRCLAHLELCKPSGACRSPAST